jgi:hypothetical protein
MTMRDPAMLSLSTGCGPLTVLRDGPPHVGCDHISGIIGAPEGEVMLCACECHESCPQAGKGSAGYLDLRSSCTCPGAEKWRRTQDAAGIDPAVIARHLEKARRESPDNEPDGAARNEVIKARLAQAYRGAVRQEAGRPADPDQGPFFSISPVEAKDTFIHFLAGLESEADVARRLGLTEAEVAAAKAAHDELSFARFTEQANLSDRQKRRVARAWSKERNGR